jgi:O-antigen/teichoic acid export membrane protein
MSDSVGSAAGDTGQPESAGAGRWIFLSRIFVQAFQLIIFLVAARVLTPAEFGVFALVQAFSLLLFMVAAAGWRELVISWMGSDEEINQIVTYALIGGIGMFAVGIVSAGGLTFIVEGAEAPILLILFSFCVLLSPIAVVFGGILVRRNRVNDFAIATIIAEVLGFGVAVAGLLTGWGVLALAAGKIAVQLTLTILVYWRTAWPYRIALRSAHSREFLATSSQILANRFIGYLQSYGTTFVVGAFLGPAGVGFFRAAERVVSSVAELVMEPLRMIAWVQFRRAADRAGSPESIHAELSAEARHFLPLFIVAAAPVFVGLAAVSGDIVSALLGAKWAQAGPVAAILALAALTSIPRAVAEPLLSLSGEIRRLPFILAINAAVTIALMLALGSYGLIALALASLFAGTISLGTTTWLVQKYTGIRWSEAAMQSLPALAALAAMTLAVYGTDWFSEMQAFPRLIALGAQIIVGALVYVATLLAIRPRMLMSVLKM